MRAIIVSGSLLALAASFGLGIVVGRFVLKDDKPMVGAPTNAIPGPVGIDNPLADPDAAVNGDPALSADAPLAPPRPLSPAQAPPSTTAPAAPGQPAPPPMVSARTETDAAMAASGVSTACDVRVSRSTPVRSWAAKDQVIAMGMGASCGTAVVRVQVQSSDGTTLYALDAQASDFGLTPDAPANALRDRLETSLPDAAIRASAYPAWASGQPAPKGTEFSQEAYESIRKADSPVVCLSLPKAQPRCIATDPASGQVKVFSRG